MDIRGFQLTGDYESDVLTRLIQSERDGARLSATELYHNCIFIGNGLWLLLSHPEQLARLRSEALLVPIAVEEMLRYEGPIQLNNRRLTAPMALGGTTLAAGSFITLGIGAANRDPRQFPDAERFDVARMEARIAFARLLARFPSLELAGRPERDRRIRFRGFRKLPVRVEV